MRDDGLCWVFGALLNPRTARRTAYGGFAWPVKEMESWCLDNTTSRHPLAAGSLYFAEFEMVWEKKEAANASGGLHSLTTSMSIARASGVGST